MSWQKNNTHLPNPHKSFEYLSRCFLFPVCLNKLRQYFVTPTSNHLTSNSSSCTWYLWKDFRLIGDFLFKVYFLRTSFPLKKNPIPWFFGMVKPEVKTWMCHLQDLVGNRFTMVWTCLWTANALVISMEVPWRSRFFCNLELLLIGVVQSWILEKRIMGPGIPSGFGTPFLSHRFLVVQNCLNIHPPKNLSKLVSFHHGYRFDFKGLSNASFHFSNPNSLDWFLTPRHLAWSFQHHLAHLSNGF